MKPMRIHHANQTRLVSLCGKYQIYKMEPPIKFSFVSIKKVHNFCNKKITIKLLRLFAVPGLDLGAN